MTIHDIPAAVQDTVTAGGYVMLVPPALGAPWRFQGGIFSGSVMDPTGNPLKDYYLVLGLHDPPGRLTWDAAHLWTQRQQLAGEHEDAIQDYTLPSILELELLRSHARVYLQAEPYWARPRLFFAEDQAFAVDIADGFTYKHSTSDRLGVRGVRRVAMRKFDMSRRRRGR